MVKTNPETGPEKIPDKSADKSGVSDKAKEIQNDTKNKLDAVVKPDEKPKDGGDKPKDGADKPKDDTKTKDPAPTNVRHNDSKHDAPPDARHKPFRHARNTVIGSLGAMAALGPSVISQIPLIGKIPYLAQASGWLQSGLSSLTTPLGLGTGANATNAVMAALPTGLGPVAGAAAIPVGLWLTGMARNLIRGDETPKGFWGNVADATELIGQVPFMPYHFAMKARVKAGEIAESAWKTLVKAPAGWVGNLAKKISVGTWNTVSTTAEAAFKPTKWGIGGALLGIMLSGGSAAAIPMAAGLGYGFLNYLKNTGALDGKGGAS